LSSAGYSEPGDGIVNQGTINVGSSAAGADLQINPHNFTNAGVINATSGSTLIIDPTNFTNSGTITAAAGSTLELEASTTGSTFSNTGTISATAATVDFESFGTFSNTGTLNITDSTVYLYGSYSASQLAPLANEGNTLYLEGALTNTGSTLTVGTGQGFTSMVLASGGSVVGGTIVDRGSGISFSGGVLSGVTYEGAMSLRADYSSAYIAKGLTLTGVSGSGAGLLNLTGYDCNLYVEGNQTLSNATVTLGGTTGSQYYDWIYNDDTDGSGSVLTLGSNLVVDVVSTLSYDYLGSAGYNETGDGIVNQGTINVGSSAGGAYLQIDAHNFNNQGTINVTNGSTLYIDPTTLTDSGILNVSAGNVLVTVADTGGGTANISGTSQITYDAASNENVTFAAGSTGELVLLDSAAYSGHVSGFTGSGTGAPATSDKLDLRDINFAAAGFKTGYANNVLTVSDGTHTANIDMSGSYSLANFHFASDGSGGTLVTDPPTVNNAGAPLDAQVALLRQAMAASFPQSHEGACGLPWVSTPEYRHELLVSHAA
jgi:hypothetical protein